MKRTAEKVLSIIAASLMTIGIILTFIGIGFYNMLKNNPAVQVEFENQLLANPTLTASDVEQILGLFNSLGSLFWIIAVFYLISLVLIIIGVVNVWNNKNPKAAGILFIVAGLVGGILSITSILLYIAGILCLTKKQPLQTEQFSEDPYHDSM